MNDKQPMTNGKWQMANNIRGLKFLAIGAVVCLAIGGGFAPWIYRPPAALQLTAPGLAEYVKFLAEVRLGQLAVQRLFFLLPLATAALALPLLAANARLGLPLALNGILRLCALPPALALLSPVWSPGVLLSAEFRQQTIIAGLAIGLAIIAPVFAALPLKWLLTLTAILAGAATGLALQQFFLSVPAIAATYAAPISLGWGGYLSIAGAAGLIISAGWAWIISGDTSKRKPQ